MRGEEAVKMLEGIKGHLDIINDCHRAQVAGEQKIMARMPRQTGEEPLQLHDINRVMEYELDKLSIGVGMSIFVLMTRADREAR